MEELSQIKLESESFLFFSPLLDLSDQFELLIQQIEKEPAYEIARVISFINAEELLKGKSNFSLGWMRQHIFRMPYVSQIEVTKTEKMSENFFKDMKT